MKGSMTRKLHISMKMRKSKKYAFILILLVICGTMLTMPVLASLTGSGKITGMKFNDVNGNGVKDPGENGIAGWTILLRDDNLLMLIMTKTDANGVYSFDQLHAGPYTVGEFLTAGLTMTTPISAREITLTDGQIVNGVDIGNHQVSASIPEFPSAFLPAILIIGFIGAVLFIQWTREH